MADMPKDVLITATAELLGGEVEGFSFDRLLHLITLTQHATDILLNEIERRGELTFFHGAPMIPYESDYFVETVLTRPQ